MRRGGRPPQAGLMWSRPSQVSWSSGTSASVPSGKPTTTDCLSTRIERTLPVMQPPPPQEAAYAAQWCRGGIHRQHRGLCSRRESDGPLSLALLFHSVSAASHSALDTNDRTAPLVVTPHDHSTHPPPAEASVATASRQQSATTPMSGARLVIGPLQGVASSAWNESDGEMSRANFLLSISVYVTLR